MTAIVALQRIEPDQGQQVGGKALGLAALIRAGFDVPPGFCVTTAAHGAGEVDRAELGAALAALRHDAVAVRSSATAEDLPDASFAGQQETVLGVPGDDVDAVADAIRTVWGSLHSQRAIAYRRDHGITDEPAMAVVVQRMVDPTAAGVLFTVDPMTQTRGRAAIDAVAGLGTGVVDGTADSDHYTVDRDGTVTGPDDGCLATEQVHALADIGRRVEAALGAPQDIEWAFDQAGSLWLLQSRAITSLFPLVAQPDDGRRAFMEVGHMQGISGPVTPLGQSAMTLAVRDWLEPMGVRLTDEEAHAWVTYIGGRMYVELTQFLRSRSTRARLDASLDVYGPRVKGAVLHLLEDPRFTPVDVPLFPRATVVRIAARVAPPIVLHTLAALVDPVRARARAFASVAEVRDAPIVPADTDAATRLRLASGLQRPVMHAVNDQLGPLFATLIARAVGSALLRGIAGTDEIDATQRGMPHNVTVEMDLALWQVAQRARPHTALFIDTPPGELARRYLAGELPDIGLDAFLERYGHRGTREIDVGVPRWREDPTGVFAALSGYLRVDDPAAAPDRRFERAAGEARAALARLTIRAVAARPFAGRVAAFLLRRNRELGGLRELPKFSWLHPIEHMRRELLRTGEQLVARGLLERPDDIMMLFWPEADAAAGGTDLRNLVTQRRAAMAREERRRHVPALLLSDGTDVEATMPVPEDVGLLVGLAAAPGLVTGRARIVDDPRSARIEPGEILVARTTDPGWTPLFLTAGGLVTETGSPMAHGPTVAREYGIPAVICLASATTRLITGQLIEIDGSLGTVRVVEQLAERPQPS